MTECWIDVLAVTPWIDPKVWFEFYCQAEEILSAKLSSLDTNDPPRRKIKRTEFTQTGEFTTAFGSDEQSRWVFGRFMAAKVEFTLHHHSGLRSGERDLPNSLILYFPDGFCESDGGAEKVERMFDLCNRLLNPFYSFSDLRNIIAQKKKPFGAVNIQEELLGVFWLTFFNTKYVEYFGQEKMAGMPGASFDSDGVRLKLAKKPNDCTELERKQLEVLLGAESFVDPKVTIPKSVGRSVLSFAQLQP